MNTSLKKEVVQGALLRKKRIGFYVSLSTRKSIINCLSDRGEILRFVRPSTVELSFAQSKELHGFRFARYRGVQKVTTQALLTAIIQNLIKWTKLLSLKEVGLCLTYQISDEIE
ncbi:transposase, partial [Bacillus cytotoxicus]|uniref:transposase n=1 Tax=Bacillus cytotoxicus TaxID=580165 RepID=UPI00244BD1AA